MESRVNNPSPFSALLDKKRTDKATVGRCLEAVSDLLSELEGSRQQEERSRASEAAAAQHLQQALEANEALKTRLRACGAALRPWLVSGPRETPLRGFASAGEDLGDALPVPPIEPLTDPLLVDAVLPSGVETRAHAGGRDAAAADEPDSPFLSPGLRRAAASNGTASLVFEPTIGPNGSFFLAEERPELVGAAAGGRLDADAAPAGAPEARGDAPHKRSTRAAAGRRRQEPAPRAAELHWRTELAMLEARLVGPRLATRGCETGATSPQQPAEQWTPPRPRKLQTAGPNSPDYPPALLDIIDSLEQENEPDPHAADNG